MLASFRSQRNAGSSSIVTQGALRRLLVDDVVSLLLRTPDIYNALYSHMLRQDGRLVDDLIVNRPTAFAKSLVLDAAHRAIQRGQDK